MVVAEFADGPDGKQYGDSAEMRAYFSHGQPLKIPGLPEDLADAIVYLASDVSKFARDAALTVDAGRGADYYIPEALPAVRCASRVAGGAGPFRPLPGPWLLTHYICTGALPCPVLPTRLHS